MGSSEHIAIVGIGAVSPFGWGIPSLLEGLYGGRTAIAALGRFDASRHRTRLAAQVPAAPVSFRFPRRASLADRYALAAAGEALARVRLAPGPMDEEVVTSEDVSMRDERRG